MKFFKGRKMEFSQNEIQMLTIYTMLTVWFLGWKLFRLAIKKIMEA